MERALRWEIARNGGEAQGSVSRAGRENGEEQRLPVSGLEHVVFAQNGPLAKAIALARFGRSGRLLPFVLRVIRPVAMITARAGASLFRSCTFGRRLAQAPIWAGQQGVTNEEYVQDAEHN